MNKNNLYLFVIPLLYGLLHLSLYGILKIIAGIAFPFCRKMKLFRYILGSVILIGALPAVLGCFLPDSGFKFAMMRIGNLILGFDFYFFMLMLLSGVVLAALYLFGRKRSGELVKAARMLVIAAFLVTVLTNAYGLIHAQDVKVHELDVKIDKSIKLDTGGEPLRIVLIGDLHMSVNSHTETIQEMVDLVNKQDADMVFAAGDFLTSTYYGLRDPEVYREILQGLKSRYGNYGVFGNHDVEEPLFGGFSMTPVEKAIRSREVTDFICSCGFNVLSDEVVRVADDSIVLVCREDGEKTGRGAEKRLEASVLMNGIDTSLPVLVLEHEPVDYKNLREAGADLVLSGHTHAGQMFPATLFTTYFNENNYGLKIVDGLLTVVTSGVGCYGPPLRVGSDSEIMVINIYFRE